MPRYVIPLAFNTMLDAKLLDEVATGANAAVNRIIRLCNSKDITIVLADAVRAPGGPHGGKPFRLFDSQSHLAGEGKLQTTGHSSAGELSCLPLR